MRKQQGQGRMRVMLLRGGCTMGLLVAALALSSSTAEAQQVRRLVEPRMFRTPPAMRKSQSIPQAWVEQLEEMSPEDQQQFLRNNERFQGLPQDQKEIIQRRLRAWNKLSDTEREAVLERKQIWQQLSPEGRREVRESLFPRWQTLPVERRRAILVKLRQLRGMDSAERQAKLNDDEFLESLSDEDRQMLRDLSMLGVDQTNG